MDKTTAKTLKTFLATIQELLDRQRHWLSVKGQCILCLLKRIAFLYCHDLADLFSDDQKWPRTQTSVLRKSVIISSRGPNYIVKPLSLPKTYENKLKQSSFCIQKIVLCILCFFIITSSPRPPMIFKWLSFDPEIIPWGSLQCCQPVSSPSSHRVRIHCNKCSIHQHFCCQRKIGWFNAHNDDGDVNGVDDGDEDDRIHNERATRMVTMMMMSWRWWRWRW